MYFAIFCSLLMNEPALSFPFHAIFICSCIWILLASVVRFICLFIFLVFVANYKIYWSYGFYIFQITCL